MLTELGVAAMVSGRSNPRARPRAGGLSRAGRKRVCFHLQFDPTNLPQYIEDHRAVWPEMQQALVNCGGAARDVARPRQQLSTRAPRAYHETQRLLQHSRLVRPTVLET